MCDAGAVVGGTLTIAGIAVIGSLGAATGTPTMLVFGTHPCQDQACEIVQAYNPSAKAEAGSPGVSSGKPQPPATPSSTSAKSNPKSSATSNSKPPSPPQTSSTKPPSKGQSNSTGELSAQIAAFTEQVRQCVDQSGQVITGNARNVDLTIAKMLHPGVIIRTGRCRVVIDKTMRGPIRIRGNQSEGLTYQMGDGVSHPLTDLARTLGRTG